MAKKAPKQPTNEHHRDVAFLLAVLSDNMLLTDDVKRDLDQAADVLSRCHPTAGLVVMAERAHQARIHILHALTRIRSEKTDTETIETLKKSLGGES